jgi:hypothetical protein
MLNINFNSVKHNITASASNKKAAYDKLRSFKQKNELLNAKFVAKGQQPIKIVL